MCQYWVLDGDTGNYYQVTWEGALGNRSICGHSFGINRSTTKLLKGYWTYAWSQCQMGIPPYDLWGKFLGFYPMEASLLQAQVVCCPHKTWKMPWSDQCRCFCRSSAWGTMCHILLKEETFSREQTQSSWAHQRDEYRRRKKTTMRWHEPCITVYVISDR